MYLVLSDFLVSISNLSEWVVWKWAWPVTFFSIDALLSILDNFKVCHSKNDWSPINWGAGGSSAILRTGIGVCRCYRIQWIAQALEVIPHHHPKVQIYRDCINDTYGRLIYQLILIR